MRAACGEIFLSIMAGRFEKAPGRRSSSWSVGAPPSAGGSIEVGEVSIFISDGGASIIGLLIGI